MSMIKARALRPGDRIAAVSSSWGGPGTFPHRYEAGKRQFEGEFGFEVVEMPHTLADPKWLADNPQARAADMMAAFADPSINGVVASIGGDDSIRLLPYFDFDIIAANPKVFVGYSDTTVSHLACYKAGLASFYGPAMMSGFAENCGMHAYLVDSFRQLVCTPEPAGLIRPNTEGWTVEHLNWADLDNQRRRRQLKPSSGWRFLQGQGVRRGHLLGGCLEVLEWLRGTSLWPSPEQWRGAFLFLETSEEAPSPQEVMRALRIYAAEGVLAGLAGILFGRPGGQLDPATFGEYDEAILKIVQGEQGLDQLVVVSGMDFGHTDPFMTLPYGIEAEVDCAAETFRIVEAAVVS
ncbi:MAG: LD-carboxypeptidase [Candidatus Latescibacteria bacterium]|nr:LD-carboxypeptidase [Candidatus Latescibacterota bacterium]